jgi:PAS domain S-box-containing protein
MRVALSRKTLAAFTSRDESSSYEEDSMKKSVGQHSMSTHASLDGFLLLDSRGQLLEVNAAYRRMSGYTEQELLTMSYADLEASDLPKNEATSMQRLMDKEEDRFETQHCRKDGNSYRVELSTWHRPTGGGQYVVSVRDISELMPAHQALQESETNFRTFFEAMDDLIFVVSKDGQILYANKAVERKLEYSSTELTAMYILELHPPDVRAEAGNILGAMLRGEQSHCPLPVATKSGKLIPVETRVSSGSWNGMDCIFGICKDLSAEQEAKQRFERFFHNNPTLMAVSTLPDRQMVDINDKFLETLGFTREEVIGRTTAELGLFVDIDRAEAVARALQEDGRIFEEELRIRRRDGKILHGLFSGEIISSHGQQYLLTVMIDITERKEMECKLRAQNERFRGIFEESVAAIYLFDEKKNFIDSNQAGLDLLGYSREELLSKSIPDVDANPVVVLPAHQQLLSGDRIINYEHKLVRKDGKVITVLNNSRPVTDSRGTVIGMQSTLIDVSERKRAEEALRESREVLHAVLNSIPVRVFWKDRNSIYLGCNTAFARDAGFEKPEEIIGKDDRAMGWRDQAELYRADDRAVIEGGEVRLLFEEPQTTPSGEQIHLLTRKVPLRDETGGIVGVLGIYQDITDRKRAEKGLELSESYLRSIIENQPGLVWLKDTDGRFLTVNKAFALSCGKSDPSDLIGLNDLDIWPKDLAEQYRSDDSEVMRTRESKIVEEPVQDRGKFTWFETFKTPVIDEKGEIIGTTGYARDITASRLASEALQQSESRYRQLFSSVMEGLVVLDTDDVIQYCNPAFVALLDAHSQEELTGRRFFELMPGDQRQTIVVPTNQQRQYTRSQYELELITMQNQKRRVVVSISPWYDQDMKYCGAFGATIDVTETRRLLDLESRALRLETAGQIAGQVAHDFNNMLAPIMAYPELIREQLPAGDPGIGYLDSIEESARKIADMNQQLLTLSRRGHYSQDVVSCNQIIQHTLRDMTPLPSTLVVETNLAADLMNIKGGAAQLHRVIMNLVTNARDAMQDVGRITITTENYYVDGAAISYDRVPRGEYVKITISDVGCGIPDSVIQTIFDPFFTTKSADKTRGSGLGLSIVDAVMRDHGGYIDLNTKVGSGTSFYLYFPITRASIEEKPADETSRGNETILMVDDDETQREVSSRLLTTLGYKVTVCDGGRNALVILANRSFDLLVLDMIMPNDIDGTETYRQALQIRPEQKAIIVSGFSESERVFEARQLGAGTFVKKPFDRKTIALAVRQELDRQAVATMS